MTLVLSPVTGPVQTALVVFGLVIAFIESWKLTLVNLAIVPIVGVIFYVKHRYTTRKAVTISNLDSKAMANVADTLSGLRTVRAYNQVGLSERACVVVACDVACSVGFAHLWFPLSFRKLLDMCRRKPR